MNKKLCVFLIIDIICIVFSFISAFIFNSPINLGLTISQSMGCCVISIYICLISILVLIIIFAIYIIKKLIVKLKNK